jgi:YegS/Rv2252/BmrU family lipid kinase
MSPARVILNPFSGRGEAGRRKDHLTQALDAAGLAYELVLTEGPRHATTLAKDGVLQGYSPILAAGGDGLISEVVNGLGQAADQSPWPVLGILPLGTANDLVDNLKLPTDLAEMARLIAAGRTRLLDVCQVNEHYFVNNGGLGLESFISVLQNQMTWARGTLRYVLATLRGIAHNPQWEMRLEWDSGSYEGPVTMISIGNAARTGEVFYTVPHADPFDGKLTFVYGYIPTRLKILQVLPKTLKPDVGNYIEHPAVFEIETERLTVHAKTPTPMHADGEIVSFAIQDLTYSILPACLPILS